MDAEPAEGAGALMDCRDVRASIVETLSGTTPPELRQAVAAHLAWCAACRAEAARAEETAQWLRAVPAPHLRDGHWDAFMVRLATRLQAERHRPWNRLRRWFRHPRHAWTTAGATAALVVAMGALLLAPARPPAGSDLSAEPPAVQVVDLLSPQVVEGMPAMNASLAVWKAGLGAGEVSYELTGGR